MDFSNSNISVAEGGDWLLSPIDGEMAAHEPEGIAAAARGMDRSCPDLPHGSTFPSRGRGSAALAFTIVAEAPADIQAREALLDRAMGPKRSKKSSEKLRRGRRPSEGLAFVARDADGTVVGTVRLWDVAAAKGGFSALLLGPLAVDLSIKGAGIGSALMKHAIAEAARFGHQAILLVGDAPYYARFGFSAEKTGMLAMPGPYERHRLLALELVAGALDGAHGVLKANGRKLKTGRLSLAA
jgi:predicted N-acetyltransferase YhbS